MKNLKQPFYDHYFGHPMIAGTPVKKCSSLFPQRFILPCFCWLLLDFFNANIENYTDWLYTTLVLFSICGMYWDFCQSHCRSFYSVECTVVQFFSWMQYRTYICHCRQAQVHVISIQLYDDHFDAVSGHFLSVVFVIKLCLSFLGPTVFQPLCGRLPRHCCRLHWCHSIICRICY